METSLRYSGHAKALKASRAGLKIHAKEKFPLDSNTHLQVLTFNIQQGCTYHLRHNQVQGELDTGNGAPTYCSAVIRHFYPDFSASLGVGLQYSRQDKLQYSVRGKKAFPITTDGLLSFNIKGRCDADKEFSERKLKGAAEFSLSIFNFGKDQDVRFKVGYEFCDKVPYFQIRENNWTLNGDTNGKWNVRFDL